MSPEQISGVEGIDSRSDFYSLACVLFECLAGKPPFDDPFEDRVLTKHQTADIPDLQRLRPDAPAPLVAVIARALGKTPEDRWQSADHARRPADAHSRVATASKGRRKGRREKGTAQDNGRDDVHGKTTRALGRRTSGQHPSLEPPFGM